MFVTKKDLEPYKSRIEYIEEKSDQIVAWIDLLAEKLGYESVEEEHKMIPAHWRKIKK